MEAVPGHVFTPLRIRTAWEQVADALRSMIVRGRLASGAQLPSEPVLAAELGVSRGTLRRAIHQLTTEGLLVVCTGANAGTFVASSCIRSGRSISELDQVLRARRVLEVPACEVAAGRADASALEGIEERRQEAATPADRFRAHRAFHLELLRAGAAPLWQQVAAPLYEWLELNLHREAADKHVWDVVADDHARIIHAVATHDRREAREAMDDHLGRLRACYLTMT